MTGPARGVRPLSGPARTLSRTIWDNGVGGRAGVAVVVVAEDDDDIREVTERALRRAGHTVTAVANGAEAWRLVAEQRPDVVVSDIDMPVMSGVELCLAIRGDARLRDLPLV